MRSYTYLGYNIIHNVKYECTFILIRTYIRTEQCICTVVDQTRKKNKRFFFLSTALMRKERVPTNLRNHTQLRRVSTSILITTCSLQNCVLAPLKRRISSLTMPQPYNLTELDPLRCPAVDEKHSSHDARFGSLQVKL